MWREERRIGKEGRMVWKRKEGKECRERVKRKGEEKVRSGEMGESK